MGDVAREPGKGPEYPLIPLGDTVMFPGGYRNFILGRPEAQKLVQTIAADRTVVFVAERKSKRAPPRLADLYGVGTTARIHNWTRIPDGSAVLVLAEGLERVRLGELVQAEPFLVARGELLVDLYPPPADTQLDTFMEAARRIMGEVIVHSPSLSNDLLPALAGLRTASELADFIATMLPSTRVAIRQALLEELDVKERLKHVIEEAMRERERIEVLEQIHTEVHEKMAGAQRESFLREQLETIRRELGDHADLSEEVDELRKKLVAAKLPEEAMREARRELKRLDGMPPGAAEASVARSYLDWMVSMPWAVTTGTPPDVKVAERILDEDHHDLQEPKRRIVEHIAVLQLKPDLKAPILCFVGPPGVGKTSLGKSIARALGRKFVRTSLGGVHDEAEIRGHRRTYVGALPGQIIQGLRRAGSRDPVFMLDEVDKLGHDFRGDPAAALLEVLDPEQNFAFRDHYLDVPFDLTQVLFITTANVLDTVPPALRDRMEVLELPGYSEEEKLEIARRFLVPRQVAQHGLTPELLRFEDEALLDLIRRYTREAGVRNLERSIGSICRKQARDVAARELGLPLVTPAVVRTRLGAPKFHAESELDERSCMAGVAVGLAWTPTGGEVLYVEARRLPREKGELLVTGHVGDVMQESARAAWSWLRTSAPDLGIDPEAFRRYDVHVHVPAGAVPKDGPSAGLAIAAALASSFAGRALRRRVALTGEITLTGQVLPVGGLKEKVLAARANGVRDVVLPAKNQADLEQDVPEHVRSGLTFHLVHRLDEALAFVLPRAEEDQGMLPLGPTATATPPRAEPRPS